MKEEIHPTWYPEAKVICSCGETFTVGATKEVIRTDVCSSCHPFFTGEQRIVDSEGQVERFMRRLERREELLEEEENRQTKQERRRRQRAVVEIVDETEEEVEAEGAEEEETAEITG
jgi:large subunit ribosomal protein L31